ncbi:proton-conducting transporter membrane subunit [Nitrosovibrio tenuis]|uniref:NADH-Ubiquinone oxidoreductase (Complex I), chain 5 N-terminus n=1 Tax=Nitrosovibrio tenuis TaxID=1233 RepID=A0A1H7H151_9PROT|nr:proton-conducting transporter membrane subunit [Nitrosovibrio tenuis]SEK43978.1 NADH-Ubiquinone oxidoreductase (complex I), chain 5 N-terminus [Nitrosovibrio tenuis]
MDILAAFIPLLPAIAAAVIGIGHLSGMLNGEPAETTTAAIASWAIGLSCLLALILLGGDLIGQNAGSFSAGQWLSSGMLTIQVNFITTGISVVLAALFAILLFIIIRFSINYLHREAGFHRFFFLLSLYASAMLLLVLSDNAVGTFIGWEIAGLCSYLLIAYAYDRPVAAYNATRVFVTVRAGDIGFILGIALSYAWTKTLDWTQLNALSTQLSTGQASAIALCFAIAAFAKSAQLPFAPWLARAAEGPTPSSAGFYGAIMVHSGVYLMILIQPILERAPLVMALVAVVGLLTAVYGFAVGLTQTDVKSSLFFATTGQLGLMFLECGLGFWQLASWHLCAHAIVRGYQVLAAPSLMHQILGNPIQPVSREISGLRWVYATSLHRFWIDQITDWALVKPVLKLAHDLAYFDDHIVDRAMGIPLPSLRSISTLAQLEKRKTAMRQSLYSSLGVLGSVAQPQKRKTVTQQDSHDEIFARGSGFAGNLTERITAGLYWFEDRLVIRGIGEDMIKYGQRLGLAANKIEQLLLNPGYLALFVLIILLVAL